MIQPKSLTVVHCPTQEDYDSLMKLLEESGFYWGSGRQRPTENNYWGRYGGRTCVVVDGKQLHFGDCDLMKDKYNVIRLSELLGCPDCNNTGVYVGFTSIEPCRRCKGRMAC